MKLSILQDGVEVSTHIELDQDIFDFLKTKAEPFVDTPNSVLRRLLGLEPGKSGSSDGVAAPASTGPTARPPASKLAKKKQQAQKAKRTRAATGTLLPEARYELPLLKALVDLGGQAPYRDVVKRVGDELNDEFLPADFETLNSGGIRWQSRLQFVRLRAIQRGHLDKDSPRGIWSITDAGRAALAEASE